MHRMDSPRVLLKDRAYAVLKGLILQEEFPPGTFLSERRLSARLEMSKTPIRAALERLEADGLVAVSPQQGILVREISLHEVIDIFDVRIALERFVALRLAGRLSESQRNEIEDNLDAQEMCLASEDLARFTDLDADFHLMLCGALGNSEIVKTMRGLRDRLYRIALQVVRREPGRLTTSCAEHRAILAAIHKGQGDRASDLVEAHLTYGKQVLVAR